MIEEDSEKLEAEAEGKRSTIKTFEQLKTISQDVSNDDDLRELLKAIT